MSASSGPQRKRRLGDFEIIREIGRGGMGIVYEARQVSLNRKVALKVLGTSLGMTSRAVVRFRREAEAAAKLHHTNIVPIYATGESDGAHFYAMELVEGPSLNFVIRQMRTERRPQPRSSEPGAQAPGALHRDSTTGADARSSADDTATAFPAWVAQALTLDTGGTSGSSTADDSSVGDRLESRSHSGGGYFDNIARMIADVAGALDYAHSQGVIHRDIKPSNLLLSPDARLSINDFGLARMLEQPGMTMTGEFVGSPLYMSPEQITAGRAPLDHRTDIYSLGATLYELLTLQPPFPGERRDQIIAQIVYKEPRALRHSNKKVPVDLETICLKAIEKDPDRRYQTAGQMAEDLRRFVNRFAIEAKRVGPLGRLGKFVQRHKLAVTAAAVIVLLAGTTIAIGWRYRCARWSREHALPKLRHLIHEGEYSGALALAERVERYIPRDPILADLWPEFSVTASIVTTPPGADVYMKDWDAIEGEWRHLGRSPLDPIRLPRGFFRWRVTKDGYVTARGLRRTRARAIRFTLDGNANLPPGMVRVPGGRCYAGIAGLDYLDPISLMDDYFIDQHEVTNKQFKEFVDRGGYEQRAYWKYEFVKNGVVLSWEDAMNEFRDATGRPGPSVWRLGDYPPGQDDLPVRGVSWYEAAAYVESVGKTLPTIYHWSRAALGGIEDASYIAAGHIVPLSNFGDEGPAPVGRYRGLGPYGTYDMAGNVKEWCWNEATGSRRYILGGAWDEPVYMFNDPDAQVPFERSGNYGFRCVKYLPDSAAPKEALDEVSPHWRDYNQETPVSDAVFESYRSIYSYDRRELNAQVESIDERSTFWTHETVSFDAAYGNERVIGHLFLPKGFDPPYQTVIFFPGSGAIYRPSSRDLDPPYRGFVLKSGRALFWPIYKGTYERNSGLKSDYPKSTRFYRDHVIQWSQDLGRSIDYLEGRTEIDREQLAYIGASWGGALGAILPALEPRLKVSVLIVGGFYHEETLPEVDQINFAPRVTIPVLMLNGRHDYFLPVDTSQRPMFRLLGSSEKDKRHVIFDTGHAIPQGELIEETLGWLDRYLGPVGT